MRKFNSVQFSSVTKKTQRLVQCCQFFRALALQAGSTEYIVAFKESKMKEFLYLHIYMFRCSFDGFVKLCLFLKVQLILDYFHTKAQFIIQSGELHF